MMRQAGGQIASALSEMIRSGRGPILSIPLILSEMIRAAQAEAELAYSHSETACRVAGLTLVFLAHSICERYHSPHGRLAIERVARSGSSTR